LKGCKGVSGVFTGAIIRMISDIRAKHGTDSVNLYDCGKFTLAEDLSDIKDIKSIDLSSISSLEGDIKALEKCTQLTSVNFFRCRQVTGDKAALKKALPGCTIYMD